jgi:predicted nucleic acid-binding protein
LLAVLLRAKKEGRVESVRQELEALRTRAKFFVPAKLERAILESAGEQ